jgi:triosephosphate isomerase
MLRDVGVKYVLCGHSERRTLFQDDDGAISRKVKKVIGKKKYKTFILDK